MVASATIVEFGPSLAWALVFELLLAWLFESIAANILIAHLPKNRFDVPISIRIFLLGPSIIIFPLTAKEVFRTLLVSRSQFLWFEFGFSLVSILVLIGATQFCARKVERHAHFAIESKRQAAFRKKFLSPRFWRGSFRRSMSRKLDRNPLLWLEYRTAWARSARSVMLLVVLLAETFLLRVMPYRDGFLQFHMLFVILFVAFLALKSSSSFQREKESGAFELLLVTPLTETKLLTARLRAVASYYGMIVLTLAAFCLVGISWAQTENEIRRNPSFEVCFASVCASIFSVPVCGFYFALRCRTFALALFSTIGLAILAPILLWNTAQGLVWIQRSGGYHLLIEVMANLIPGLGWPSFLMIAVYHLAIAAFCARATLALLRKREFVFC
jgi:ABC-type transport system involved in multi-copper enzyme maturation permease subunit